MSANKKPAASPNMVKRVLIVRGKVQRVGYRGTVQDTAQEMGVGGTVRNLPDGTVQIICTGTRQVLDSFETKISIKAALIQVSDIARQSESPAGSASRIFKVIPDAAALEAMEAGATGAKYLALVAQSVASTAEGVKRVDSGVHLLNTGVQEVTAGIQDLNRGMQDVKSGVQELNRGVNEMNHGMQQRFDNLEARYGEIGATATAIADFLRQIHEEQVNQRNDQAQQRAQMAQLVENNNRALGELTSVLREMRSSGARSQ